MIDASEPPPTTRGRPLGLILRAVQVRLRFVVVLAVAFVVVGRWEQIRDGWDRLTRAARGVDPSANAVSPDTGYFCPMDPGVVSDWPGKCGACNMALVRRKKGDATPLPSGVVARMQLSPYRVQLAGIRTSPANYRPLSRDVVLVGTVGDGHVIDAEAFERDLPLLAVGQAAEVKAEGASPLMAKVRAIDAGRVRIEADDPSRTLRPGMRVVVTVRRPVADLEPFRSLPSDPPPLRKGEPRTVYGCPTHIEVVTDKSGKCVIDGKDDLEPRALLANQRVGWWCPMHPTITDDRPGFECKECGGMKLVPRVVTYRPKGHVLAVPESSVVQTGTHSVVFLERMPGMFDGVEVGLGPRCGDLYPIVSGLEPGQRVASAGAFLLDAETRLNPSLAAGYFGAANGRTAATAPSAEVKGTCPVTGKPLGSMGPPVRITVAGRSVVLCCKGCEGAVREAPEKYLSP
jgi:Cu(I)/Ag(I) efflux system membrane fusion protein